LLIPKHFEKNIIKIKGNTGTLRKCRGEGLIVEMERKFSILLRTNTRKKLTGLIVILGLTK
jgi:hypothetical protein